MTIYNSLESSCWKTKKNPSRFDCHDQTAYVKDRFICETDRLISDIIETSDVFNIDGFLVTMDIEKAFDSLNHSFLLVVLKKFGFDTSFINWIETILNK